MGMLTIDRCLSDRLFYLRGVAVMMVVGYHTSPTSMPYGFMGVDLFFLSSGYVIHKSLHDNCAPGSGRSFVIRRISRLAPPLLAALLIAQLCSLLFLSNEQIVNHLIQTFASIIGLQNYYLAATYGSYFSPNSDKYLLLHLWSIAVEIQLYFYILLPYIARRIVKPQLAYFTLAIASYSYYGYEHYLHPASAYFSLLSRAAPFFLGAALAASSNYQCDWNASASKFTVNKLLLGASAIFTIVLVINGAPTPWAVSGLMVCLMAVAVNSTAAQSAWQWLPFSRVIKVLGQSCYSVYLFHWVFLSAFNNVREAWNNSGLVYSVVGIFCLVSVACVMRTRYQRWAQILPAVLGVAFLLGIAPLVVPDAFSDGRMSKLTWLLGGIITASASYIFIERKRQYALQISGTLAVLLAAVSAMSFHVSDSEIAKKFQWNSDLLSDRNCPDELNFLDYCSIPDSADQETTLFLGDSHGNAMFLAFSEVSDSVGNIGMGGCLLLDEVSLSADQSSDRRCARASEAVSSYLRKKSYKNIIIAHRWSKYNTITDENASDRTKNPAEQPVRNVLSSIGSDFIENAQRIWIVLQVPEFVLDIRECFPLRIAQQIGLLPIKNCELTGLGGLTHDKKLADSLAVEYEELPVAFIDPRKYLCGDSDCMVIKDGEPLYRDNNHLSVMGSRHLRKYLTEFLPL